MNALGSNQSITLKDVHDGEALFYKALNNVSKKDGKYKGTRTFSPVKSRLSALEQMSNLDKISNLDKMITEDDLINLYCDIGVLKSGAQYIGSRIRKGIDYKAFVLDGIKQKNKKPDVAIKEYFDKIFAVPQKGDPEYQAMGKFFQDLKRNTSVASRAWAWLLGKMDQDMKKYVSARRIKAENVYAQRARQNIENYGVPK
jgi:hypothetical protein